MAIPVLSPRASVRLPSSRFQPLLSEPGVPISGTGLSSGIMRLAHGPLRRFGQAGRRTPPTSLRTRHSFRSTLPSRLRRAAEPVCASTASNPYGSTPSLMHVMLPESSPSSRGPGIATPASLLPSDIAPHLRSLSSTGITRRHQSYGPLRHPDRPGLPLAGVRLARTTPPTGLPVLRPSPSSMRAAANTPADPVGARVARFPADGSLPRFPAGSASALPFSRPAQRSLLLRPAWSLSHPR